MKVIEYTSVPLDIVQAGAYIKRIDFSNMHIAKILRSLTAENNTELLKVLNSINNQNIQSIDVKTYSYVHRNNELSFTELSNAEKLFLVAYGAVKTKNVVYFRDEVESLTDETLYKFIRMFKRSKYVNIACIDSAAFAYYSHKLEVTE